MISVQLLSLFKHKRTEEYVEKIINDYNPDIIPQLERIFYKKRSGHRMLRRINDSPDLARSIMDQKHLPGVVRFVKASRSFSDLLSEFSL